MENVIFYGPPGTGKTYYLQDQIKDYIDFSISDVDILNIYQSKTEDWLLIALILIQNPNQDVNGIQTKCNTLDPNHAINVVACLQAHEIKHALNGVKDSAPKIFYDNASNEWNVDIMLLNRYDSTFYKLLSPYVANKRYAFVTFHQSFSYEDFVEGIRPEVIKSQISYSPQPGVFKHICDDASKDPSRPYAIFIDEINRGNISEIFGELISLIEIDKRQGAANQLEITLPYSKKLFSVPANLNIYGTMNSADHSIGTIDIALRRRFKFISMNPNGTIIEQVLKDNKIDANNVEGIDVIKLFDVINKRIELLLDRHHLIGHTYFLKVKTYADISDVIVNRIIPLLEEYFFNDLGKIQLIFNDLEDDGTVRQDAIYKSEDLEVNSCFGDTGEYLLTDKKRYSVSSVISKQSIKHIYE